MWTLATLLLTTTVLPGADAQEKPAGKGEKTLWAAVSVSHPVLQGGERGGPFQMHFALVNDGADTINPDLGSSQLLVNGKEMKDWPFLVGNGPRDRRWEALPPGDYLAFSYALGDHFPEPGVYKVAWKGKGFQSAEVVFRVLPRTRR